MGDARLRELVADREPGLAGADNDNLDPIGHPRGRFYAAVGGAEWTARDSHELDLSDDDSLPGEGLVVPESPAETNHLLEVRMSTKVVRRRPRKPRFGEGEGASD